MSDQNPGVDPGPDFRFEWKCVRESRWLGRIEQSGMHAPNRRFSLPDESDRTTDKNLRTEGDRLVFPRRVDLFAKLPIHTIRERLVPIVDVSAESDRQLGVQSLLPSTFALVAQDVVAAIPNDDVRDELLKRLVELASSTVAIVALDVRGDVFEVGNNPPRRDRAGRLISQPPQPQPESGHREPLQCS